MSPEQAGTAGRVAVHGAAARSAVPGVWAIVDPAAPGGQFMLNAAAMAARDLVWAVGQAAGDILIERWDGGGWKAEAAPKLAAELHGAVLQGVATAGRDSAIAVGGAFDRLSATERPLAYGWDGLAWTESPLPDLGAGYVLTDVAARAGDDAWAVGSTGRPLVLRRDGGEWRPAELPEIGDGRLAAVAAAGEEVWAVGVAGAGAARRPLILRWDGRRWQEVRCQVKPKLLPRGLSSVAIAEGRVWAGGGGSVLSWDGSGWRRYDAGLATVNTIAVSRRGVWAAGGKGGLSVLDGDGFRAVATADEETLWLGAAADDETVWLVGSRQGPGGAGEPASRVTGRAGHLVSE